LRQIDNQLRKLALNLEKLEEHTKSLFVVTALVLYGASLILLAREINPVTRLDEFLVKSLANLAIPFSVILLQELFALVTVIHRSPLRSAACQFEIVALVILRSFFKDFYKLNAAVAEGHFSHPVQVALVKVISLALITVLVVYFHRLSRRAGIERQQAEHSTMNLVRQSIVLVLCIAAATYVIAAHETFDIIAMLHSFDIMPFIRIVFTSLILIDAVFFLLMISKNSEFDTLMFEGALVVSLIFARFPLFAANIISFPMAVIGVAISVGALRLFIRPKEMEFLGHPQEDDVVRLDMTLTNQTAAIPKTNEKSAHFLKQFHVGNDIVNKVQLACDELLNSSITSACSDNHEHGINVSLAIFSDRLVVTISDDGHPLNPFQQKIPDTNTALEDRDIIGLEAYLVRAVMDKVSYKRETGRNVVTLLIHTSRNCESVKKA
jgi:anti-sigma regulatory factor (Ser/Thr protein kinase)